MGNCLRNNQISAQEESCEPPLETCSVAKVKAVEQMKTPSLSASASSSTKLKPAQGEETTKKMVRFKLEKDDIGDRESCSDGRSGAVRIRVVVTQKELKRILGCNNESKQTSLQQLLSAMKLRGRTISGVGEWDWGTNPWRPALESIPEDRSMK